MTTVDELEASARRLDALAATVGTLLDPIVAFHRPDVWRGGRAIRFGQDLLDQRTRLGAAAAQLAADARLLRARAELLRVTQGGGP